MVLRRFHLKTENVGLSRRGSRFGLKEFIHEALLDLDESLRISQESSRQLEMLLKMLFSVLKNTGR